jgi:hypothetical protein
LWEKQSEQLDLPDIITFATSERWLNRTLYPKQATVLKIIFLRDDLFTDFDYEVIAQWEQDFRDSGNNGTPPGVIKRIKWLQQQRREERDKFGYFDERGWFRELILVLGRRAGKGYISAIAMAYVLYRYMAAWNPQQKFGIDRDKRMTCLIYAGRKEQARDNLWRDLVNIIQGAPCFKPYISKPMGESLSVFSPTDLEKREEAIRNGTVSSGLDPATFKIDPLPATPMSGRGGASFMIGFDEMAHMVATGANRSSDEVWLAATPSLDQFGIDAFIVCPSSPWEMIGQFYVEWTKSQEIDGETGFFAYPEIFMLQLASWEIYEGWELTRNDGTDEYPGLDMFPTDIGFIGDLGEYADQELPKFTELFRPIQAYDSRMQQLERADPDGFAVERRSHWQATLDAYLDPKKILSMFAPMVEGGPELQMVTKGALGTYYKAHGDPGFVNDNFGFAVAHTVTDTNGHLHVVFDYLHQWVPYDFPDNTVDLIQVTDEIWDLTTGFPLDDLSFDQHQSMHFFAELNNRVRKSKMPKTPQIHIINETAPYNLKVAQTFKVALNQGWIHAPYSEDAELQLKFLQFKNGKVTHQTAGPVQHDDLARAMFEVVFHHLERQVSTFLMENTPLSGASLGGAAPFMHPGAQQDANVSGMRAFSRAASRGMGGAGYSPARGRPNVPGRGRPGSGRMGRR